MDNSGENPWIVDNTALEDPQLGTQRSTIDGAAVGYSGKGS